MGIVPTKSVTDEDWEMVQSDFFSSTFSFNEPYISTLVLVFLLGIQVLYVQEVVTHFVQYLTYYIKWVTTPRTDGSKLFEKNTRNRKTQ